MERKQGKQRKKGTGKGTKFKGKQSKGNKRHETNKERKRKVTSSNQRQIIKT